MIVDGVTKLIYCSRITTDITTDIKTCIVIAEINHQPVTHCTLFSACWDLTNTRRACPLMKCLDILEVENSSTLATEFLWETFMKV